MKNTTDAGPVSPNWTGACFFGIEHLLLTAACRKQTHHVPETKQAPAQQGLVRRNAATCQSMQVTQVAVTGFEQVPQTPGNSNVGLQSGAQSGALSTGMHHLDPQLQLLIDRWPTLSKAVQQQIMLLVG
jgi:hypothetical protein